MPIKKILVHMSNDEQHMARLDAALMLAERFQAHLEILYVATPVSMPATITGRGASYAYLAEATAIAHEKAEQIQAEVTARCAGGVPYTWLVEEGDHVELLAKRSTYADLALVSQSHPEHLEDRIRLHVPDLLPMHAACPTLVLPWSRREPSLGTNVLIAWKETREASRAVRDALPFIEVADKVTVLTIQDAGARKDPGRELVEFLAHHGITARHRRNLTDDASDTGEIILAVAREEGCDSLVMGAYGHSRLRELMMGGVTRHVLGHMDLPALMSH